jgi:hypothetical protein
MMEHLLKWKLFITLMNQGNYKLLHKNYICWAKSNVSKHLKHDNEQNFNFHFHTMFLRKSGN